MNDWVAVGNCHIRASSAARDPLLPNLLELGRHHIVREACEILLFSYTRPDFPIKEPHLVVLDLL